MRKLHTHEASPLDATGTIFTGAKIHTVDDNTAGAEAFLVFGNRFAAVGTLEECRTEARRLSTRTTAVVELDGATVVPRLRRSARTPVDVTGRCSAGWTVGRRRHIPSPESLRYFRKRRSQLLRVSRFVATATSTAT